MNQCRCAVSAVVASVVMVVSLVNAAETEREFEDFSSAKFARPTTIDNEWFPLKPGTRYVWDGMSTDEEGDVESHSVASIVTDLTKVIDGVRTLVCMDEDFVDGELEEAEIAFFAQDDDGNIWYFGEYPEEYDNGKLVAAPTWVHGIHDGKAGIMMKAEPKLGDPSYAQGLSLSLPWTDRAQVYKVGETTTVPFGTFEDVMVIQEWNDEEANARQLKYYARGVGNVRVGWSGDDSLQETLELLSIDRLSGAELERARNKALKLEKSAYENSKDVYGQTKPIEQQKAKAAK